MTEAYEHGYRAFCEGSPDPNNPYNWVDGHDMHPNEYFEWQKGWLTAQGESDES